MRHAPIDPSLFEAHRRQLVAALPPRAVAIVHAADILPATGDGTFPIHPAADLFYLTGIEQEESVLVLAPNATDPAQREMLFLRQPNEHLATWEGEKLTKDRAREISGIPRVRWLADLPSALHVLLCESDRVLVNANEHERSAAEVEPRDVRMARQLMDRYPLHRFERLAPILRQLRAVKDPAEVDLVRRAIDITDAGLRSMLAALRPGVMEYELEAELHHVFVRNRARMAYEPIIASGKNACVLHYNTNDRPCGDGDLLLVVAGERRMVDTVLGTVRNDLARPPVNEGGLRFCWVVDFPLFEAIADDGAPIPAHHPFTAPHPDDRALLERAHGEELLAVRSQAYDLVCNGWELGSGSVRIHDGALQARIFERIGIDAETAQARFGFLLDAFRYGAPPHAGFAFGIDRLVGILAGEENIREVIAFPKTQSGADPLTGAPTPVDDRHLRELGIQVRRRG